MNEKENKVVNQEAEIEFNIEEVEQVVAPAVNDDSLGSDANECY
jgi:hypothetical protein